MIGPVKPCVQCGTPTRDADVAELRTVVKVLDRALPIVTEDGAVVVGFRVHDEVECARAAVTPRRQIDDGPRPSVTP